jgi:membrane-associated protein
VSRELAERDGTRKPSRSVNSAHMTSPLAAGYLASPISPDHLLGSYGLIGLLIIIFAECGLLVGFFLPGDTLLFSAGLVVAINDPKIKLPALGVLLVTVPIAAVAGNLVGYWIGREAGPKVFDRPRSRIFKPEYVTRSQAFFDRFGPATILLARFVPIVRTVATVMAGVGRMRYPLYVLYSVIGGIVWTDGILLLGYWLGHIKFVRDTIAPKIDLILITVIVLSLLPTLIHLWRGRRPGPEPSTEL